MSKLFGTDGIRGSAGRPPLDPRTVRRVGAALVRVLSGSRANERGENSVRHLPGSSRGMRVLIGGDTRESYSWIERELAAGLGSEGATVVSGGVAPTPAIAFLTHSEGFDAGIVVSASHNPYADNGIKVFSSRGEKLDEQIEGAVEQSVADASWSAGEQEPDVESRPELLTAYLDHLRAILPQADRLIGSRLVVDCANGATTTIAPELFRDLGFEVQVIGNQPDGRNINLACGSTHLGPLQAAVRQASARLGVAFDGDGDRALFVDRHGHVVDGDAILFLSARQLRSENRLTGNLVVATVMSNLGLELALAQDGVRLQRAPVGDKYVMEQMREQGAALGGEQSGHIIFADHLSTGDGIGTALQVLRVMEMTGAELDALAAPLITYPQVLVNVRVRERSDYRANPAVSEAIARVEERLSGQGRLLIRYSGTEPLLRIMIEGRDSDEIRDWANDIADTVRRELA